MASIKKIKVGDNVYSIVPELGNGFVFGTSVSTCDSIYVHTGNARVNHNGISYDTGIGISYGEMVVDSNSLTTYLKALGFKTE
jgi:hypothetical protein